MVIIFVAKTPGNAKIIAACTRRGWISGKNFSSGSVKQRTKATANVTMLANVVRRKPPRHTPRNCSKLFLFCAERLTQPFCKAREEVACPIVIKFINCPTHAKADGGRKTASNLLTTKTRTAFRNVTIPEPKNNFMKFTDSREFLSLEFINRTNHFRDFIIGQHRTHRNAEYRLGHRFRNRILTVKFMCIRFLQMRRDRIMD